MSSVELSESNGLGITPGQLLKQLRLEKGMSLADVEKSTCLPQGKLEKIEEDDFSNLGPSVFVQGYVRRYAKLVGGNADAIVEAFRQATGTELPESAVEDVLESEDSVDVSDGGQNNKRLTIAVGVVLFIVTVCIMLFSGGSDNKDSTGVLIKDEEPTASTDISATELDAEAYVFAAESGEARGDDVSIEQEGEGVAHSVDGIVQGDIESNADDASVEVVAEENSASSSNVDEQVTSITQNAPGIEAENVVEFSGNTDESDESLLEMSFIDVCWVDIKDKNGASVFADIQKSGDNLRLFGQAPFDVMLGNARGVSELRIDSVLVDIVPKGAKKTLKLTVARPY